MPIKHGLKTSSVGIELLQYLSVPLLYHSRLIEMTNLPSQLASQMTGLAHSKP